MASTPTSGLGALSPADRLDLLGLVRSSLTPKRRKITFEDYIKGIIVLTEQTNPQLTDFLVVVHDISGTPAAYQITVEDFLNSINLFGANLPHGRWAMLTGTGSGVVGTQFVGDTATFVGLPIVVAATATQVSHTVLRTQAGTDSSTMAGELIWRAGDNLRFRAVVSPDNNTNTRCWAVMTDDTAANISGTAEPNANLFGFRYDPVEGDTEWKACINNGGAAIAAIDLTAAPTDTPTVLEMQYDVSVPEIRCYYNNNFIDAFTAVDPLPDVTALMRYVVAANVGGLNLFGDFQFYHLYIETDK